MSVRFSDISLVFEESSFSSLSIIVKTVWIVNCWNAHCIVFQWPHISTNWIQQLCIFLFAIFSLTRLAFYISPPYVERKIRWTFCGTVNSIYLFCCTDKYRNQWPCRWGDGLSTSRRRTVNNKSIYFSIIQSMAKAVVGCRRVTVLKPPIVRKACFLHLLLLSYLRVLFKICKEAFENMIHLVSGYLHRRDVIKSLLWVATLSNWAHSTSKPGLILRQPAKTATGKVLAFQFQNLPLSPPGCPNKVSSGSPGG